MKIAILDDYLDVALGLTDWQQLGSDADIQVFQKPFSDTQETVSALREFGVIVAMRERTGFPAEILAQLPELQLLVTTGMRNLSIDMNAAKAQGI
ncbi:MAG: D-2-hydroxyacid dehydrogenase family protein, partial [bacterium]